MAGARILLAILLATNAAASISLGPVSTAVPSIAACRHAPDRCLAVAGNGEQFLLVWQQTLDGRSVMRASSGGAPFTLVAAESVDRPSIAFDGDSYFVTWRHSQSRAFAVSGAVFAANGSVLMAPTLLDNSPLRSSVVSADVVWTGLEYAVALRASVVFFRDGVRARESYLLSLEGVPIGASARVNGGSILVVREVTIPPSCGGFTPRPCIGGGMAVHANVVGSRVSPVERVLGPEPERFAISVAAGGDGYLLVWKSAQVLWALRLDQAGRPAGSLHTIAASRLRGGTSVAVATRDGWLVAWDDLDEEGAATIEAAELSPSGRIVGRTTTVASGAVSPSILELGPDRYRLFFRDRDSIDSRLITTGSEPLVPRRRSVR